MVSSNKSRGFPLRLLRNEPTGADEIQYTTGTFTTDITSTARQLAVSFGRTVQSIRVTSEQALTNVQVTLNNAAGAAVATLVTGKTVAAGATMIFPVFADHAALLQDGTLRMTAEGNAGSTVGIEMSAIMVKSVKSVKS